MSHRGFSHRQRKTDHHLVSGECPYAVADRFGITPGRVSQLQQQFERSWAVFQEETVGEG